MKKTFLIACNILILFFLFGCYGNISTEEYKRAENGRKEAIPVIYDHFKSKYGMDVEIESATAEFHGGGMGDWYYSGVIRASVYYNDRTFSARVANKIVYDNYQVEEMEQACRTYVFEKLDLPEPAFYKIIPHYQGNDSYGDFGALLVNEYFDGTNIKDIFNMISPDFVLIYESDAFFDSGFSEKVTALFDNTLYDEQSMEFIILKKGSANKMASIRSYYKAAESYAPYVEYSMMYRKNEKMGPELYQPILDPLSNELPILKEFLVLKDENDPDDFVIRQEEPPQGWDMGRKFEQITPSYHFLWNEDRTLYDVFIPPSVWKNLCEKYDEIHLIECKRFKTWRSAIEWPLVYD